MPDVEAVMGDNTDSSVEHFEVNLCSISDGFDQNSP